MAASWRNFRVVENVRLSVQETTSVAETSHRTSDDAEKKWHNGPDKNSGLKDEEDQDSWNEDLTEKVEERNAQEYLLSEMKKTAQNICDKVEEIWEVLKKIPRCLHGILLVLLRVLLLAGQFLAYALVLTSGRLKMPNYFFKLIELGRFVFAAYLFLNFPCVLSHCEGWFLASDLLNQTLIIRNDHDVYCSFKSTADTPKTYRCGDNITAHILNNTCMKIKMKEWPEKDCLLEYGRRGRGESSKLEKHFCSNSSVTKPTGHLIGRTHTPAVISSLLLLALLFVGLIIYLLRKKIKTSHRQETLEEHFSEEEEEGKPKTEKVWEKGRAFLSLENAV